MILSKDSTPLQSKRGKEASLGSTQAMPAEPKTWK